MELFLSNYFEPSLLAARCINFDDRKEAEDTLHVSSSWVACLAVVPPNVPRNEATWGNAHCWASEPIIGDTSRICVTPSLLLIIMPGLNGKCTLFHSQLIKILQRHPRAIKSLVSSILS